MPSDGSSNRDKRSLHYIFRSGLAGGVAGCVAKTVVAPLDRVKILFQASNPDYRKYAGTWSGAFRAGSDIYRDGGVRGLLQGHSATLLRVFPYAAIKFMAYDQVRAVLMPTREDETNVRRFSAGAISGMISVFFTYPLDVIRVRMAYQTQSSTKLKPHSTPITAATPIAQRPSFIRAVKHIYHESATPPALSPTIHTSNLFTRFPLLQFYRGFTVTLTGMIPYAGTSFLVWDFLRARFLPPPSASSISSPSRPTPIADLTIGAISGALAQTASYPFEVVRRRMQVGGLVRPDRWLGWGETARSVWRSGGWRGFYVGLGIGFLKIVPMTAVSFAVWQSGKRLLGV